MKQDYIAVADKSRIYPPGVAANGDGFDVCFISEAESCGLLLFKKGSRQPVARIPFPHEGRMGNVHFMTVKGEFEGLEYAFEEDGKEAADPFGRQFAKALDVVDTKAYVKDENCEVILEKNDAYTLERLVQCKYFECLKYDIYSEVKIGMDETSFLSVLFISGEGTIETDDGNKTMPYKAGESFFISAGKRSVVIKGTGTCIVTHV